MRSLLALSIILLVSCGQSKKENLALPHVTPTVSEQPTLQKPEEQQNPEEQQRKVAYTDNIYGVEIANDDSWRVASGKFYNRGVETKIKGINWFGFETSTLVVHGLWTGRSMDSYLKQIKELGFNSLRIPISPQALECGQQSTQGKYCPIDNLKDLLSQASSYQFNILLDLHNCNYQSGLIGSPIACPNYGKDAWFKTLETLANLAKDYPSVLGIDLINEPYNLSWKEWQRLSSEGGKRVLTVNPRVLVFVEGVGNKDTANGGKSAFWGENLFEAGDNLPDIPLSRLVLSPHVYGPSVAYQDYFNANDFPSNMPAIWDAHYGYLVAKGLTLAVGEFGGRYVDKDKILQDKLVEYLGQKSIATFWWSWNPNSGDTGGILQDDWLSVNWDKVNLLKRL